MTSYLRKYITALAAAKDYIAQWSSEHLFADEELIVPFPTLAMFDPNKNIWFVRIKAWIYVPLQTNTLKTYLPTLPSFLTSNKNEKTNNKEDQNEIIKTSELNSDIKVDQEKTLEKSDDDKTDSDSDFDEKTLKENPGRLGLFFVGNSVKIITKAIINGVEHLLQPSDESGFIEECLELSNEEIQSSCTTTHCDCQDKIFDFKIQVHETTRQSNKSKDNDYKTFSCTVYLLAPQGFSIISDIDDTIKKSNVLRKGLLLKYTFYSYFKPIEGMNDLYQKWNEQNCQFHYVSASPWQLYPALHAFLEQYNFPMGTMNLRKFTWSLEFFKAADTYKIETISEIIDSYPLRKYICVGDSGELDPEIYSKLYIKYSESIIHIFIRDICQTSPCLPTCEERYKTAFANIPKERWTVFKDPTEIERDIKKILPI